MLINLNLILVNSLKIYYLKLKIKYFWITSAFARYSAREKKKIQVNQLALQ